MTRVGIAGPPAAVHTCASTEQGLAFPCVCSSCMAQFFAFGMCHNLSFVSVFLADHLQRTLLVYRSSCYVKLRCSAGAMGRIDDAGAASGIEGEFAKGARVL
jgi:hypothetical protein